ncbi:MAG: glycoside hydrolase family 3 N-terminal domain-containing protein [Flavobacteriaceae bacterium]|nr:glycoside hydrolase family 3 N-terminal domain-containing protein [Flavobacteriaceae bacterium]
MKKIITLAFKIIGIFFSVLIIILLVLTSTYYLNQKRTLKNYYSQIGPPVKNIFIDGIKYRDLNKNGLLDPYENHLLTIEERVQDLTYKMTIEEKSGLMYLSVSRMNSKGDPIDLPEINFNPFSIFMSLMFPGTSALIIEKKINHFGIREDFPANIMAKFNNNIQKIAERTRLGIPITIASDPRHSFKDALGTDDRTSAFSTWPSALGLAATRDSALVRKFGTIAREEYKAVGIRLALHPMADLATEPRWARNYGTFGEDAKLASEMTYAYIKGFQGDTLSSESVACVTKHFPGGGPQKDGEDAHFPYGKDQVYPGGNFYYHLIPFSEGAFKANTAQIMPYYGIPQGQTSENVSFNFNKEILTTLLRDSLKFKGVVTSDWSIISPNGILEKIGMDETRAWGVENLTPPERLKKAIDAGCDQIGGESNTNMLVELIKSNIISEDRINVSVKRLLRDKFTLGLFDNPYVNENNANNLVNKKEYVENAEIAQKKSTVLLKNDGILPLAKKSKIYLEGFNNTSSFNDYSIIVDKPENAEFIIKKINTPYEKRSGHFFDFFIKQGRLYYQKSEIDELKYLKKIKPLITIVNLERAAILTPIDSISNSLIAEFGVPNKVISQLIFGEYKPSGKLPVEIPRNQKAVENQLEDVPYDSENPLYKFGHGLTYSD